MVAAGPAPIVGNAVHHRAGHSLMQLHRIRLAQVYLVIAAQLFLHTTQDHGGFHHKSFIPLKENGTGYFPLFIANL
ncbi:hypothetical protein SDC9_144926 [bioreactor metagenome]|uniref:Uncharacterized protein n=1 Tax=bioreactor metagenome TaxID=1076179 RepID=A0A645E8L2_9ZZZZ